MSSNQDLAELVRQQESLREVIESISSELELRPLLTRIVRHACELLNADRGSIGLVDETRNIIRTEAVYHMPPNEMGAEMAPGVGLAGRVLLTHQPVVFNRYGDLDNPTQLTILDDAVVGLPIFWRDRMIGFFGVGAAPPRHFTDQDIEKLALFGRHAAIAIENARLFAAKQQALGEAQLLYETSRRISMAVDVDEVIAAYLEHVAMRGRYACTVVFYEFNAQEERTAVIIRGRWAPTEGLTLMQVRLPYTKDELDTMLDAGETVKISNVHTDSRCSEELRQLQTESQRPALAMIPLMVGGHRIGLVILSYTAVHEWLQAELRPYEATAAQLAIAINTRQQQLLLYESDRQVAVLRERQRLARELHDSVTQLIFSMTLIAQSITPAWQRSIAEGKQRVNRLLELSQNALAEMRALLFELRLPEAPPTPTDTSAIVPGVVQVQRDGLIMALEKHIAGVSRYGPAISLEAPGYTPHPLEHEIALYRITQEALNNVVKHAQASHVQVELWTTEQQTCLVVQDDGIGFDVTAVDTWPNIGRQGHLGLKTMQERAEALGGKIKVISAPGAGTRIEVTFPCAQQGSKR